MPTASCRSPQLGVEITLPNLAPQKSYKSSVKPPRYREQNHKSVTIRAITKILLVKFQFSKKTDHSMYREGIKLAKLKAIIIIMNFQWKFNINLTRSMSVYSKENWKLFWEIFLAKTIFSIIKVGSYVRANSMVYFWPYKNEMYFGFWRGASTSLESVPHSRIFPNKRRPFNQWYKVQLIQSTHDGRSCRQELKINNQYVWQKTVPCPSLKTGIQDIYTCGNSYVPLNAQIKNFKFFTHPWSTSWFWNKRQQKLFFFNWFYFFERNYLWQAVLSIWRIN